MLQDNENVSCVSFRAESRNLNKPFRYYNFRLDSSASVGMTKPEKNYWGL